MLNNELIIGGKETFRIATRLLCALGVLLLVSPFAQGEILPIKTYTIADGLVSNKISRIVRDSRGFLWFCTEGGLSRFDGYTFTNYTTEQGLPSNWVDDFLEIRGGVFLVATYGGLCVFDPLGVSLPQDKLTEHPNIAPMFTVFRPGADETGLHMKVLYEDSAANIWCGTLDGLYRIEMMSDRLIFHYVELGIQSSAFEHHRIAAILEEAHGVLLIATRKELFRRFSDGRMESITSDLIEPDRSLMGLTEESDGSLWMGTRGGLYGISRSEAAPGRKRAAARLYSAKEGLPCLHVNTLFRSNDGRLWVGTACGLYEFLKDESRFRPRLDLKDMKDTSVWSLAEDVCGNLWIGTAAGAIRLARNGFTTYTEADGIGFRDVYRIAKSSRGEINLYTRFDDQHLSVDRFDGERFVSQKIKPRAFPVLSFDWYQDQFPIRDSRGEWWWPTREGLFRFAAASRIEDILNSRPIAHYTVRDGLPSDKLHTIYEDSRGDIWISVSPGDESKVARWERATGAFLSYAQSDGLPTRGSVSTVCEDKAGNLWVGFEKGDVARFRGKGFTTLTTADGIPEGAIKQLLCDSAGRIWIASGKGGLGRIDDPASERPRAVKYTVSDGLASNSILSIAEEGMNRLYVATARGLNHFNFDTGSVRLFTATDGLANVQVDTMFSDGGAFWFGTSTGVSRRLTPAIDVGRAPPPIFINEIKVVGRLQHISEIGETNLRGLEFGADQNHIEIGFGSLFFAAGDLIRYQFKLEGADADWQPLTFQRSVNYANLKPGSYRFFVRAVNSDGGVSPQPAMLEFRVDAPFWLRWWFLALAAALTAVAIYSIYRYQLTQKLRVERVRTRIATDLHDDISTNLSLIAMASEVAGRRTGKDDLQMSEALSLISGTSRELVDSMSDIVWAVNPKRDRLVDLIQRMRRFASDVFAARGIAFRFNGPFDERDIRLGAETRREVLLIVKEAVSNIARHSQCTEADIELRAHAGWLEIKIRDNGVGFDANETFEGNGLVSMRHRAERMGGSLDVVSMRGEGATVTLKAPLK